MGTIQMQKVRAALADLESDIQYRSYSHIAPDARFHDFRQGVDLVGIRCLSLPPDEATPTEIRERLRALQPLCTGRLGRFGAYIGAALLEVDPVTNDPAGAGKPE